MTDKKPVQVNIRMPEELKAWFDEYAKTRPYAPTAATVMMDVLERYRRRTVKRRSSGDNEKRRRARK